MENKNFVLKTPYEELVDLGNPWAEYPRPCMIRDSFISLNGEWELCVSSDEFTDEYPDRITVPFPPESRLSGYCKAIPKDAYLHYRRKIALEAATDERIILHFGAVDRSAEVSVNGVSVGSHTGGYLPFSFDITEQVSGGESEICVKVTDGLDTDYPYGKQCAKRGGMWYTPVSGIWQTVWIERVPNNYIESYQVEADMNRAVIRVKGGDGKCRLVLDGDEGEFEFNGECDITPKSIRLWSPEEPNVYRFTLESGVDRVRGYFAMRSVGTAVINGVQRITLNGKPYFFNGLLDQGYYPDGIFLPATADGYRDDILLAKRLGFNMLRKHIKVEPEIFYYLADTLGIAVFQDMVNNSGYSFLFDTALPTVGMKRFPDGILHRKRKSREIFKEHSVATVDRLRGFASVVYYTVFNEGWGQFCADEMYRLIKNEDRTRIIDSTSGWFVRRDSDVDSRHVYFKPIKVKKPSERPIVISEFGGYSLRVDGHLFGEKNYGYMLCKSEEELLSALEKLYLGEILPLIGKGISALVYTQISDVEDETNGFITYDRQYLKTDAQAMRDINERLYAEFKRQTDDNA